MLCKTWTLDWTQFFQLCVHVFLLAASDVSISVLLLFLVSSSRLELYSHAALASPACQRVWSNFHNSLVLHCQQNSIIGQDCSVANLWVHYFSGPGEVYAKKQQQNTSDLHYQLKKDTFNSITTTDCIGQ